MKIHSKIAFLTLERHIQQCAHNNTKVKLFFLFDFVILFLPEMRSMRSIKEEIRFILQVPVKNLYKELPTLQNYVTLLLLYTSVWLDPGDDRMLMLHFDLLADI